MPKTRAYSREELQGLRRADLQRLCKTYDIKGANAKSDVLIELLAQYFQSPAYGGLSRQPPARTFKRAPPPTRPSASLAAKTRPAIPASSSSARAHAPRLPPDPRPALSRTTAAGHKKAGPPPHASTSRTNDPITPRDAPTPSAFENLKTEVEQLRATVARLENEQATLLLALMDGEGFQQKLRTIVAAEVSLSMEQGVRVEPESAHLDKWKSVHQEVQPEIPVDAPVEPTPATPSSHGKRKQTETHGDFGESAKRVRRDTTVTSPQTLQFQSRRSLDGQRAEPSSHSPASPTSLKCALESASPPQAKPDFPLPSPSLSKYVGRQMKVVKTSEKREAADHMHDYADHPSSSQAALACQQVPASPRSPSESGRGVNSGVGPPQPAHVALKGIDHNRVIQRTDLLDQAAPPKKLHLSRASNIIETPSGMSPAREYMDVALNGLAGSCRAHIAPAPNSRTMLGTERYRDTRFGDEPIVTWGTPSIVDFGPPTPIREEAF